MDIMQTTTQADSLEAVIADLKRFEQECLELSRVYQAALTQLDATEQEADEILAGTEQELLALAKKIDQAELELDQATTKLG